jgi:hypothetical protein
MDIARAVFVTLALLGVLGLVTADATTAAGTGGVTTNDGGSIPPPDRAKR